MEAIRHTEVLIVGAGPSGLMMAAQLLRHGITPRIIDAKPGPDRISKAVTLHARSLEFFRQLGLADDLLTNGSPCYGVQVHGVKKPLGSMDLTQMDERVSAFPFIHIIGQDQTERLLIKRLTENTCPVIWDTRLVDLRQDDQVANATVEHKGSTQQWQCKWVIGADGRQSLVRQRLALTFTGRGYDERFFLADVSVPDIYQKNIHFYLAGRNALAIFPLPGKGKYRLIGKLPSHWTTKDNLTYGHVKPFVDGAMGAQLPVGSCTWASEITPGRQIADQYAHQRSFLIGDAAHAHSPIGGQGLNIGLQDAVNLAWKLAAVVDGRVHHRILHTYQQERMPLAKEVIRSADAVLAATMAVPYWLKPLRDRLLSVWLRWIGTNRARLAKVFSKMAQLNTSYRKSVLAVHHAAGAAVRAGDRLPFLPVFDEKTKIQTDLHRWCEKPGFVLLILGTISHHHLNIIGQWMRQKYPRGMFLYYLPYSPRNQQVFDAFEVKQGGTKSILVRPDMYIGYINDMLNVSLVDTYMEEVIGWEYAGRFPDS